jgi:folate-binding protein YgfZ
MVADMWVYALPDALLLDVPTATETPLAEYLDRFLIMERAEIEDVSQSWAQLSLQGPFSPCALTPVLGAELAELAPWAIAAATFDGTPLYVARAAHCGEDGFDLFVPSERAPALWAALCAHRAEFAVHSVGWEALNVRRLEAGIPWWGEELDNTLVPLEARLDHAISLHKGCYVGQEIIARIDARGHVNNLLAGFFVEGDALPLRGTEIHHNGKRVGKVMSALHSPRLDRPVALGYLRRELQEPGTQVLAQGESAAIPLTVTGLPFVPHDYPGKVQEC